MTNSDNSAHGERNLFNGYRASRKGGNVYKKP